MKESRQPTVANVMILKALKNIEHENHNLPDVRKTKK